MFIFKMKIRECCKTFGIFAGVGLFAFIETGFFVGSVISIWLCVEFGILYIIPLVLSALGFLLFPFAYILFCGVLVGATQTKRYIEYDDKPKDYYVTTEWESSEDV